MLCQYSSLVQASSEIPSWIQKKLGSLQMRLTLLSEIVLTGSVPFISLSHICLYNMYWSMLCPVT